MTLLEFLPIIVFGSVFVLLAGLLIYISIKQHKCNHSKATYGTSKDNECILVHCTECNKTVLYHLENNIVTVLKLFTGITIRVTRIMNTKENKIDIEIEKL